MDSGSGLRIREIRENRRDSGILIAQILGISPQYYYDLEKGKRNLSTELATKLANHFSVSIDYLLGHENIPLNVEAANETYLDRPEIKDLLEIVKDATKKDIENTIKIIKALKEK